MIPNMFLKTEKKTAKISENTPKKPSGSLQYLEAYFIFFFKYGNIIQQDAYFLVN